MFFAYCHQTGRSNGHAQHPIVAATTTRWAWAFNVGPGEPVRRCPYCRVPTALFARVGSDCHEAGASGGDAQHLFVPINVTCPGKDGWIMGDP